MDSGVNSFFFVLIPIETYLLCNTIGIITTKALRAPGGVEWNGRTMKNNEIDFVSGHRVISSV